MWLTPMLIGGVIGFDVLQLIQGQMSHSLSKNGGGYLGAAIGAEFTALVYFVMFRNAWGESRKMNIMMRDVLIERGQAEERNMQTQIANVQLKTKVATLEKKLSLAISEDIEIATPMSSLEEVLTSRLTKE